MDFMVWLTKKLYFPDVSNSFFISSQNPVTSAREIERLLPAIKMSNVENATEISLATFYQILSDMYDGNYTEWSAIWSKIIDHWDTARLTINGGYLDLQMYRGGRRQGL